MATAAVGQEDASFRRSGGRRRRGRRRWMETMMVVGYDVIGREEYDAAAKRRLSDRNDGYGRADGGEEGEGRMDP